MDNFELLSTLKDYADTQGWHFLSGDNFYQNYEASQKEYYPGDLVLSADFDAAPIYSPGGKISQIRYTGVLALGRKVDETPILDETRSTLDETFWQKYVRRLEELMKLLSIALTTIACDNDLELENARFRLALNKFDTNIDFISGTVTIIQ
jgi:hypothetical protein